MRIAVLGTGIVGQTLAVRLAGLGHDVVVGTRDVTATMARAAAGSWVADHPGVSFCGLAPAAAHGELVINATSGSGSIEALGAAGAGNLAGKVLIDVANPLDFSAGMPPTLLVKDTDSLAEQIQRAHPQARVVKTLNTVTASVMVDPQALAGGDHTMFLAGDEPAAKTAAAELLREFGWRDIVDLGDLTNARGMEMVLALWVRLYGVIGTPEFNIKVVR